MRGWAEKAPKWQTLTYFTEESFVTEKLKNGSLNGLQSFISTVDGDMLSHTSCVHSNDRLEALPLGNTNNGFFQGFGDDQVLLVVQQTRRCQVFWLKRQIVRTGDSFFVGKEFVDNFELVGEDKFGDLRPRV